MPYDLSPFGPGNKLRVVAYGNGACRNGSVEMRNLLAEIASHGFLVVAVGSFKNSLFETCEADGRMDDPQSLTNAIDWAIKQNELENSRFFNKIGVGNIALMGQSCGGFMALGASKDPRVTTLVMLNTVCFLILMFLTGIQIRIIKKVNGKVSCQQLKNHI
jgi:dienelactone hydrolase